MIFLSIFYSINIITKIFQFVKKFPAKNLTFEKFSGIIEVRMEVMNMLKLDYTLQTP
jgi:hypothetical protein